MKKIEKNLMSDETNEYNATLSDCNSTDYNSNYKEGYKNSENNEDTFSEECNTPKFEKVIENNRINIRINKNANTQNCKKEKCKRKTNNSFICNLVKKIEDIYKRQLLNNNNNIEQNDCKTLIKSKCKCASKCMSKCKSSFMLNEYLNVEPTNNVFYRRRTPNETLHSSDFNGINLRPLLRFKSLHNYNNNNEMSKLQQQQKKAIIKISNISPSQRFTNNGIYTNQSTPYGTPANFFGLHKNIATGKFNVTKNEECKNSILPSPYFDMYHYSNKTNRRPYRSSNNHKTPPGYVRSVRVVPGCNPLSKVKNEGQKGRKYEGENRQRNEEIEKMNNEPNCSSHNNMNRKTSKICLHINRRGRQSRNRSKNNDKDETCSHKGSEEANCDKEATLFTCDQNLSNRNKRFEEKNKRSKFRASLSAPLKICNKWSNMKRGIHNNCENYENGEALFPLSSINGISINMNKGIDGREIFLHTHNTNSRVGEKDDGNDCIFPSTHCYNISNNEHRCRKCRNRKKRDVKMAYGGIHPANYGLSVLNHDIIEKRSIRNPQNYSNSNSSSYSNGNNSPLGDRMSENKNIGVYMERRRSAFPTTFDNYNKIYYCDGKKGFLKKIDGKKIQRNESHPCEQHENESNDNGKYLKIVGNGTSYIQIEDNKYGKSNNSGIFLDQRNYKSLHDVNDNKTIRYAEGKMHANEMEAHEEGKKEKQVGSLHNSRIRSSSRSNSNSDCRQDALIPMDYKIVKYVDSRGTSKNCIEEDVHIVDGKKRIHNNCMIPLINDGSFTRKCKYQNLKTITIRSDSKSSCDKKGLRCKEACIKSGRLKFRKDTFYNNEKKYNSKNNELYSHKDNMEKFKIVQCYKGDGEHVLLDPLYRFRCDKLKEEETLNLNKIKRNLKNLTSEKPKEICSNTILQIQDEQNGMKAKLCNVADAPSNNNNTKISSQMTRCISKRALPNRLNRLDIPNMYETDTNNNEKGRVNESYYHNKDSSSRCCLNSGRANKRISKRNKFEGNYKYYSKCPLKRISPSMDDNVNKKRIGKRCRSDYGYCFNAVNEEQNYNLSDGHSKYSDKMVEGSKSINSYHPTSNMFEKRKNKKKEDKQFISSRKARQLNSTINECHNKLSAENCYDKYDMQCSQNGSSSVLAGENEHSQGSIDKGGREGRMREKIIRNEEFLGKEKIIDMDKVLREPTIGRTSTSISKICETDTYGCIDGYTKNQLCDIRLLRGNFSHQEKKREIKNSYSYTNRSSKGGNSTLYAVGRYPVVVKDEQRDKMKMCNIPSTRSIYHGKNSSIHMKKKSMLGKYRSNLDDVELEHNSYSNKVHETERQSNQRMRCYSSEGEKSICNVDSKLDKLYSTQDGFSRCVHKNGGAYKKESTKCCHHNSDSNNSMSNNLKSKSKDDKLSYILSSNKFIRAQRKKKRGALEGFVCEGECNNLLRNGREMVKHSNGDKHGEPPKNVLYNEHRSGTSVRRGVSVRSSNRGRSDKRGNSTELKRRIPDLVNHEERYYTKNNIYDSAGVRSENDSKYHSNERRLYRKERNHTYGNDYKGKSTKCSSKSKGYGTTKYANDMNNNEEAKYKNERKKREFLQYNNSYSSNHSRNRSLYEKNISPCNSHKQDFHFSTSRNCDSNTYNLNEKLSDINVPTVILKKPTIIISDNSNGDKEEKKEFGKKNIFTCSYVNENYNPKEKVHSSSIHSKEGNNMDHYYSSEFHNRKNELSKNRENIISQNAHEKSTNDIYRINCTSKEENDLSVKKMNRSKLSYILYDEHDDMGKNNNKFFKFKKKKKYDTTDEQLRYKIATSTGSSHDKKESSTKSRIINEPIRGVKRELYISTNEENRYFREQKNSSVEKDREYIKSINRSLSSHPTNYENVEKNSKNGNLSMHIYNSKNIDNVFLHREKRKSSESICRKVSSNLREEHIFPDTETDRSKISSKGKRNAQINTDEKKHICADNYNTINSGLFEADEKILQTDSLKRRNSGKLMDGQLVGSHHTDSVERPLSSNIDVQNYSRSYINMNSKNLHIGCTKLSTDDYRTLICRKNSLSSTSANCDNEQTEGSNEDFCKSAKDIYLKRQSENSLKSRKQKSISYNNKWESKDKLGNNMNTKKGSGLVYHKEGLFDGGTNTDLSYRRNKYSIKKCINSFTPQHDNTERGNHDNTDRYDDMDNYSDNYNDNYECINRGASSQINGDKEKRLTDSHNNNSFKIKNKGNMNNHRRGKGQKIIHALHYNNYSDSEKCKSSNVNTSDHISRGNIMNSSSEYLNCHNTNGSLTSTVNKAFEKKKKIRSKCSSDSKSVEEIRYSNSRENKNFKNSISGYNKEMENYDNNNLRNAHTKLSSESDKKWSEKKSKSKNMNNYHSNIHTCKAMSNEKKLTINSFNENILSEKDEVNDKYSFNKSLNLSKTMNKFDQNKASNSIVLKEEEKGKGTNCSNSIIFNSVNGQMSQGIQNACKGQVISYLTDNKADNNGKRTDNYNCAMYNVAGDEGNANVSANVGKSESHIKIQTEGDAVKREMSSEYCPMNCFNIGEDKNIPRKPLNSVLGLKEANDYMKNELNYYLTNSIKNENAHEDTTKKMDCTPSSFNMVNDIKNSIHNEEPIKNIYNTSNIVDKSYFCVRDNREIFNTLNSGEINCIHENINNSVSNGNRNSSDNIDGNGSNSSSANSNGNSGYSSVCIRKNNSNASDIATAHNSSTPVGSGIPVTTNAYPNGTCLSEERGNPICFNGNGNVFTCINSNEREQIKFTNPAFRISSDSELRKGYHNNVYYDDINRNQNVSVPPLTSTTNTNNSMIYQMPPSYHLMNKRSIYGNAINPTSTAPEPATRSIIFNYNRTSNNDNNINSEYMNGKNISSNNIISNNISRNIINGNNNDPNLVINPSLVNGNGSGGTYYYSKAFSTGNLHNEHFKNNIFYTKFASNDNNYSDNKNNILLNRLVNNNNEGSDSPINIPEAQGILDPNFSKINNTVQMNNTKMQNIINNNYANLRNNPLVNNNMKNQNIFYDINGKAYMHSMVTA
ncbi:hypothetical protein PMALA_014220 [Plasmodium malariae]|uniref:C2H2-type domain-containing protein n=2 Tax=Plasmodium malariae TaxID=5858 RepID=A0A1A8VZ61_PLAMA|nr:hypothetical protein PMALA_014220 [Plasmodium malariae]